MKGYIYKITSPTGRIYIGQTKDIYKREHSYKKNYNKNQTLLYNSIKKHGYENHIFEIISELDNCTRELLDDLEKHYIRLFCSFNDWNDKGMNLTTGGQIGHKISNDTKKRLTEITNPKLVNVYDKNMNLLHSDITVKDAAIIYNVISHIGIYSCCNGKFSQCKGYVFRWSDKEQVNYKKADKVTNRKPVIQYDIKWNFVSEYNSIRDAERAIGTINIRSAIVGESKTIGGFRWLLKEDEHLIDSLKKDTGEVYSLDMNGNIVDKYISSADARSKTGLNHIKQVLKGLRRTCGGLKWVYAKDFKEALA